MMISPSRLYRSAPPALLNKSVPGRPIPTRRALLPVPHPSAGAAGASRGPGSLILSAEGRAALRPRLLSAASRSGWRLSSPLLCEQQPGARRRTDPSRPSSSRSPAPTNSAPGANERGDPQLSKEGSREPVPPRDFKRRLAKVGSPTGAVGRVCLELAELCLLRHQIFTAIHFIVFFMYPPPKYTDPQLITLNPSRGNITHKNKTATNHHGWATSSPTTTTTTTPFSKCLSGRSTLRSTIIITK